MREAVICEPLRTPVGRFGGMFRDVPVTEDAESGRDQPAAYTVGHAVVSELIKNWSKYEAKVPALPAEKLRPRSM